MITRMIIPLGATVHWQAAAVQVGNASDLLATLVATVPVTVGRSGAACLNQSSLIGLAMGLSDHQ